MPSLSVLIADDEAPARSRLRRMLQPFVDAGRLRAPVEAADGVEALAVAERAAAPYGLLFLDVRMPGLDGFGVLDRLPPAHRPAVVFTTAYDEYALRAFEANAVDYLLKPVAAERLADAVARAEAIHGRSADGPSAGAPSADDRVARLADLLDALDRAALSAAPSTLAAAEAPLTQFTVQGRDRLLVVAAEQVVAAEVHDGITNLYVHERAVDGRATLARHIVPFPLDTLEARLDPALFMRVHRGALVRLAAIREMVPWFSGRYKLVLEGGHEVTASRTRSRELKERLSL